MIMLVATLMFFVTNLHFEVLRALIESYVAVPLATVVDAAYSLDRLSKVMTESLRLLAVPPDALPARDAGSILQAMTP